MEPFKFLSQSVLDQLVSAVPENLERYRSGDFNDLAVESGWAIDTTLAKWNPEIVGRLDPAVEAEAEINNSLMIYNGFKGMTPALAREERLWARLCHVEFLEFARARWLRNTDHLQRDVENHFFGSTLTGCRDDNAIGRLWWNGYVASLACPDDQERGLRLLLSRANIRLQVIDRADTAFRTPLLRAVMRRLEAEGWLGETDTAIADFMYELNKRSGGKVFEAMNEAALDQHLSECVRLAKDRAKARENRGHPNSHSAAQGAAGI